MYASKPKLWLVEREESASARYLAAGGVVMAALWNRAGHYIFAL